MIDNLLNDLNSYRVFYVAATSDSFSKAANELGKTQAAVSSAIKVLESELNVQLFERTSKGIKLTPEGKNLLYYVEKAFGSLTSANMILQELRNKEISEINIGVPASVADYVIRVLKIFNESNQNIKINLFDKNNEVMLQMLERKEIDLIIDTDLVENNDKNIEVKKLKDLSGIFVGSSNYEEISKKPTVNAKELSLYPLILPSETTTTRKLIDSNFRRRNVSLNPILSANSSTIAKNLIESGMGIGWLISEYVEEPIKNKELFKINVDVDEVKIPLSIAYQKLNLNEKVKELIELLKNK